jgi:hypothetical protein
MGKITSAQYEKFLELLAQCGNITIAAEGAGISRKSIYNKINSDLDYSAQVEEAKYEAVERLEHVARQRAERGSDVLLIFLLKSLRPDVYRDNYRGSDTPIITDYIIDLSPRRAKEVNDTPA